MHRTTNIKFLSWYLPTYTGEGHSKPKRGQQTDRPWFEQSTFKDNFNALFWYQQVEFG